MIRIFTFTTGPHLVLLLISRSRQQHYRKREGWYDSIVSPKILSAGMRIGFVSAPDAICDVIEKHVGL